MKAFWVDVFEEDYQEFSRTQHAKEAETFLYWDDKVLLVGNSLAHEDLKDIAVNRGVKVPEEPPDGAGNMSRGEIVGWGSTGFKLITPNKHKEALIDILEVPECL